MNETIDLETILAACADDGFDDGIRLDADLEPLAGAGSPVKPAVYEGGVYQEDRRWATPGDAEPTRVIVIDNVPSQANRLEDALRRHRKATGVPEFVLDLSGIGGLPAHLPGCLSSLQFPHRNADAYLRDAKLGDTDFLKSEIGQAIFGATAQACGPLVAWFPQALLYGFWQSHLGKKRANTKHARAWVSEIVGWGPAPTGVVRVLGLKGDPLNLNTDEPIHSNPDDRLEWTVGAGTVEGGRKDKLSEIGHGQVPFMGSDASAGSVSFARVTQRATVSFAQLRRISPRTRRRFRRRRRDTRPPRRSGAACPPAGIRQWIHAPLGCRPPTRRGLRHMAWRPRRQAGFAGLRCRFGRPARKRFRARQRSRRPPRGLGLRPGRADAQGQPPQGN